MPIHLNKDNDLLSIIDIFVEINTFLNCIDDDSKKKMLCSIIVTAMCYISKDISNCFNNIILYYTMLFGNFP